MASSALIAAATRKDIQRYALMQKAGQQAARVASEFPEPQQLNAFLRSREAKIKQLVETHRESPPRVKSGNAI